MSNFTVKTIHTPDELRDVQAQWNDLWQASDVASPSARAEQVALWLEHFHRDLFFSAIIIEQDGQFLAALPLIRRRLKGFLLAGSLPRNDWTSGGDLLLRPGANHDQILDELVRAALDEPFMFLWLDGVAIDAPRWQSFCQAMQRQGGHIDVSEHGQIPQVEIRSDWKTYEMTLPKGHRSRRRRNERRLNDAGPSDLEIVIPQNHKQMTDLIRTGFEVEHRSWKGETGTSVLGTPGILEFYQQQAELMNSSGHLELAFLKSQGKPIAFMYLWKSKGTWFIVKIGYDKAYRKFGPGQQIVMRALRKWHENANGEVLDFWGKMDNWSSDWATGSYTFGRIFAAPPKWMSPLLVFALGMRKIRAKFARNVR